MKLDWLWGEPSGGMWAKPDPNRAPHTLSDDAVALLMLVARVIGWVLRIAGWLAAGALLLWSAVYLYVAAQIAPPWVWLIVAPLLGIWWQIAKLSRTKEPKKDAAPR